MSDWEAADGLESSWKVLWMLNVKGMLMEAGERSWVSREAGGGMRRRMLHTESPKVRIS